MKRVDSKTPLSRLQIISSVSTGAANKTTVRTCPFTTGSSKAATIMINAGGNMKSNIVIIRIRTLQQITQQFGKHNHGQASQKTKHRIERKPSVHGEVIGHRHKQLSHHRDSQNDDEPYPQLAYRLRAHQPMRFTVGQLGY